MNDVNFDEDVEAAVKLMEQGGIILYPTDTIWGIGCDATQENSVKRIFDLKKREDSKSMIILVAEEKDILQYVAAPDLAVFDFIQEQSRPTTIIFEHAVGLPDNLISDDGSIAIRIVQDSFCRHLIKRLRKPIVSTSANISGQPSPQHFQGISDEIKRGVDYIVKWRQNDLSPSQPSQIVKWKSDGNYEILRK